MSDACPVVTARGVGRPDALLPLVPSRVFDGLVVVLAVLGGQRSAPVAAALEHAGARVRVTFDLAGARRMGAQCGHCATVVIDPPTITGTVHAGLQALSRHGALLLLSDALTTRERIDVLDNGADSVISAADPDEVVAALAAVLRRSGRPATGQPSLVASAGEIRVHLLHRTATAAGRELALTPLEFDLLAYLVAHAGEALSRDRLLKDVWGYDFGGQETVTVHIRRLRTKIEDDPSQPGLLQTVWGVGYRLNPHPAAPTVGLPTQRRDVAGLTAVAVGVGAPAAQLHRRDRNAVPVTPRRPAGHHGGGPAVGPPAVVPAAPQL